MSKKFTNLQWIEFAPYKFNSFHLTHNEHHSYYQTAEQYITEDDYSEFKDVDPFDIKDMKKHDSIWTLQIYDISPVGFYRFHGSTLDDVIDKARKVFPEM